MAPMAPYFDCGVTHTQLIQLQAAIEQNETYESYIVTALLKMDDMERMIESLREGWFKVLRWYKETLEKHALQYLSVMSQICIVNFGASFSLQKEAGKDRMPRRMPDGYLRT
ncbi:hypothetical protein BKA60DRAFT_549076 [Fusarium oxysporum]|nr:hypothetical protein BKA60DRAFT_549076 [Fusarium oxysporum]